MDVVLIDPEHPKQRLVQQVADALRAGAVVAFPTDTVYGIGCALGSKKAIERIYAIKDRSRRQPLAMLVPDISGAARYAQVHDFAYRVLRAYTPGPFCWVLESTKQVPKVLLHRHTTTGIRIPDSLFCQQLLEMVGAPIVTTTAAPVGDEPLEDPHEIQRCFKGQLDLLVDGGPGGSVPTTVVSLVNDEIEVIRHGAGELEED